MSEAAFDPRRNAAEIDRIDAEAAQARANANLLMAKVAEASAAALLAQTQARYEPWKAFAAGIGTVVATILATIGVLRLFGIA